MRIAVPHTTRLIVWGRRLQAHFFSWVGTPTLRNQYIMAFAYQVPQGRVFQLNYAGGQIEDLGTLYHKGLAHGSVQVKDVDIVTVRNLPARSYPRVGVSIPMTLYLEAGSFVRGWVYLEDTAEGIIMIVVAGVEFDA